MKSINGSEVKNLITKFYYKNNNLCFHIFLNLLKGSTISYGEFTDYNEYKKTYNSLLLFKESNNAIDLSVQTVAPTDAVFS